MIYGLPVVALVLNLGFGIFAAPCDFIDGPCYENWASGPQMVSFIALFIAAPVAVAFGIVDLTRGALVWRRRRKRRSLLL